MADEWNPEWGYGMGSEDMGGGGGWLASAPEWLSNNFTPSAYDTLSQYLGGSGTSPYRETDAYANWLGANVPQQQGNDFPTDARGNIVTDDDWGSRPAQTKERGILGTYEDWGKTVGGIMNNPITSMIGGLGGGLWSYLDAQKKNKMLAKMQAEQRAKVAARQAFTDKAPELSGVKRSAIPVWGAHQRIAFNDNNPFAGLKTRLAADGGPIHFDEGGPVVIGYDDNNVPIHGPRPKIEAEAPRPTRPAPPTKQESILEQLAKRFLPSARKAPEEYRARGGYLQGGTPGQSDKIPAMLSDGEFVMDADTVSALGDGNNAAGASALDQMRRNIRKHKRSAPVNKIPPKAKKPEQYFKGAK